MIGWASLAVTLTAMVGGCAEVQEGPVDIPSSIEEKYCVKEVALISQVLAEAEALTSCVSESSCDRAIDTEDEGYFETWHLYADEASTVVLEADSEFDNLMQLALITEVTEEAVEAKVIAANDDRSADDSGARIAATLEAAQDYLLRLSSFGDEETGCYTIRTIRVGPDDPLPEPPDTGSVGVMVSSTGAAPASYTVTLNGKKAKPVPANGTATYSQVIIGEYAVELSGLGDCLVNGENPQNATVDANQTTTVNMALTCTEVTGECDPDDPNACVDGNDCTRDGTCNGESLECEGGSNELEATPCGTGGVCDGQGRCVECNGPQQCDDSNECTDDTCGAGSCNHDIVAGRLCDYMGLSQGGLCNQQGQCAEAPQNCPPGHCPDTGNDCTENLCNPSDGSCSPSNVVGACEDAPPGGNPGNCSSGVCVGLCVGKDCKAQDECQDDSTCNPSTGACLPFPNKGNGTPCSLGTCQGGVCRRIFPCTEQGIRDAIAKGGDHTYTFDCGGPRTVLTDATIAIVNNVTLDGEGDLTVEGKGGHRVLSVPPGVTAEIVGMTVTGGFVQVGGAQGGGILNEGMLTITDSVVEANRAEEGAQGGGIYSSGTLTVVDSVVRENSIVQGEGGGIYNDGTLILIRSGVSGNEGGADAELGAGIDSTGTLTLIDSHVSDNSAGDGAGIEAFGTLTLINSTVTESPYWGIISVGTATIINSTVDGTQDAAIVHSGGTLRVVSSTVTTEESLYGQGTISIASGAQMIVANSLIIGPRTEVYDRTCYGPAISLGGNIESPTNDCGLTNPSDLVDVSAEDLKLGPLADNGGPTMTFALLPGSVAIDWISEAMCVDEDGSPLTTDQRGEPRPAGAGSMCDAGSFEVQP